MLKDYTHISVVLDASGSMHTIKQATIEGFNSFVLSNKQLPGKLTTLVTQFNNMVNVGTLKEESLGLLNEANYHPMGSTALYDAIGSTINATGLLLSNMKEDQRPEKVIFLIVTDGEENSSKEFTHGQIATMVKLQKEQYQWEFIFMGANIDAMKVAGSISINCANALTYGHNSVDTANAWMGVSSNTMSYRVGRTVSAAFTREQMEEQQRMI
jgi:hypothetical protein